MSSQDFQFFPPRLAELQEQELAWHRKSNEITATLREAQGPEDTPEKLEEERRLRGTRWGDDDEMDVDEDEHMVDGDMDSDEEVSDEVRTLKVSSACGDHRCKY